MTRVTRVAQRAGRLSPYTMRAFYLVVLGVSLTGAGQSATRWLNWWAPFAFLAVAAVELGGVSLSIHADRRRQLGERAIPARVLSAAIALGAVAVNYFGHVDFLGQAAFFAGMSATGYAVYLIDSSARRRDALRRSGQLPPAPPAYGPLNWIRRPGLTRRARALAMVNAEARMAQEQRLAVPGAPAEEPIPALTGLASLQAATAAVRAERRAAAISSALRTRIAKHVDPTMADIAVNTYDLDEIAARLARDADYDGLTAILAAELLPARLHRPSEAGPVGPGVQLREVLTPAAVVPLTARLLPILPVRPPVIAATVGPPAITGTTDGSAGPSGSARSSVIGQSGDVDAAERSVPESVPDAAEVRHPVAVAAHRAVPDGAVPGRSEAGASALRAQRPQVLREAATGPVPGSARQEEIGQSEEIGRRVPQARRAVGGGLDALAAPVDVEQMNEDERRQDARRLYRASVAVGQPLRGAELARIYKQKDPKWGTRRINDVRKAEGQAVTEATGEFPMVVPASAGAGEQQEDERR